MNIADRDIEKMYAWIIDKMKFDKWYPIKSDLAFETIMILFKEDLIKYCEFDENETHFRKVDVNL